MEIRFKCKCGKQYKGSEVHRGKQYRCKSCGEMFTVPGSLPSDAIAEPMPPSSVLDSPNVDVGAEPHADTTNASCDVSPGEGQTHDSSTVRSNHREGPRLSGEIISFDMVKSFGWIRVQGCDKDIFFHINDFEDKESDLLYEGDTVEFNREESAKGYKAVKLKRIRTKYIIGRVKSWNENRGFGTIHSDVTGKEYFAHFNDIRGVGFRKLVVGEKVSFTEEVRKGKSQAGNVVRWDPREPLEKFANMGNSDELIDELAEMALDEKWDYKNTADSFPNRILHNYFYHTFLRIQDENKILSSDNSKYTIFNTGLVDKQYRPIYAVFEKKRHQNRMLRIVPAEWTFREFCVEGNVLLTHFRDLPRRANYFTEGNEVIFDTRLRLDIKTEHIIGERLYRLPKALLQAVPEDIKDEGLRKSMLAERLKEAYKRAITRIEWNYKTAIPQFYHGKLQLLLPLCINDPRRVDVALAVQRKNEAYVGYTILDLDMAYNNARLITRPDSDWLTPTLIEMYEEDMPPQ